MSDLKESGQLEQDADAVVLLHRPAYYQPSADREIFNVETGRSPRSYTVANVAKNRHGPPGVADLVFNMPASTMRAPNWREETAIGSWKASRKKKRRRSK